MIKMILAMDEQGGIGKNGRIPWYIKEDLKYFKEYTKNTICLMGRKTFEDIKNALKHDENTKTFLKDRKSVVFSRNAHNLRKQYNYDNTSIQFINDNKNLCHAIFLKLKEVDKLPDIEDYVIIGGSTLYNKYCDVADEISITHVNGIYDCDVKLDKMELLKDFEISDCLTLTDEANIKIYKRKESE